MDENTDQTEGFTASDVMKATAVGGVVLYAAYGWVMLTKDVVSLGAEKIRNRKDRKQQ